MSKNLFVFVTKNGVVYDRTNGKNIRIRENSGIKLEVGSAEFFTQNKQVYVRRLAGNGNELYTKEITESGMYLVSAVFVQALPKSSKEVRNLYNRLKTTIGAPKFKIDVNEKLSKAFKIKLHTWIDKGFNYRFMIMVKDSNMDLEMMNTIYSLIDRAAKLDLRTIIKYYGAFNENGLVVSVDEEFLSLAQDIIENSNKVVVTK